MKLDFDFGSIEKIGQGIGFNPGATPGQMIETVFFSNNGFAGNQFPIITLWNRLDGECFFRFIRGDGTGGIPQVPHWIAGVDQSHGGGHLHYQIFRDTIYPLAFTIVEDGSAGFNLPDALAHPSARVEVRQLPGGTGPIFRVCDPAGTPLFEVNNNGPTGTIPGGGGVDTTHWTPYTPAVTGQLGALGAYNASGRYKQLGKTVFVQMTINITDNGSAAGGIVATLPVSKHPDFQGLLPGRENNVLGKMCQGYIRAGEPSVTFHLYDDGYPGGTGTQILASGVYEAA